MILWHDTVNVIMITPFIVAVPGYQLHFKWKATIQRHLFILLTNKQLYITTLPCMYMHIMSLCDLFNAIIILILMVLTKSSLLLAIQKFLICNDIL